jgi:protein gp37
MDVPVFSRKPAVVLIEGDVFAPDHQDAWISQVFSTMRCSPHLKFLLLTGYPQRAAALLGRFKSSSVQDGYVTLDGVDSDHNPDGFALFGPECWPVPNVWLGVPVSAQPDVVALVPPLLGLAEAGWRTWVSVAPICGPVDLSFIDAPDADYTPLATIRMDPGPDGMGVESTCKPLLGWVLCAGGASPAHPDWIRRLRNDCQSARVPFYFEAWGAWIDIDGPQTKAPIMDRFTRGKDVLWVLRDGTTATLESLTGKGLSVYGNYIMARVGETRAGHLLDCVEHREGLS